MRTQNETLIIKSGVNDFEEYYNNQIKEHGIELWTCDEIHENEVKNFVLRQLQVAYRMLQMSWHKKLKIYKNIIVFEDYRIIPWLYFFKAHDAKIVLWEWNTANERISKRVEQVRKYCEIWTFDEGDAKRYNWKLNSQFYFQLKKEKGFAIGQKEGEKKKILSIPCGIRP